MAFAARRAGELLRSSGVAKHRERRVRSSADVRSCLGARRYLCLVFEQPGRVVTKRLAHPGSDSRPCSQAKRDLLAGRGRQGPSPVSAPSARFRRAVARSTFLQ